MHAKRVPLFELPAALFAGWKYVEGITVNGQPFAVVIRREVRA
jgi:hypothetical protein